MSLDISLRSTTPVETTCNCCGSSVAHYEIHFEANITHNLVPMAKESNLYNSLWGASGKIAKDISWDLWAGLTQLKAYPDVFKKFDAANGWGKYEDFVRFVEEVYEATQMYPDAEVNSWS
jgi:hypothetical protein